MNQVFFIGNFFFAIYITFKYLCRLHINQPLIVLFYAIAYLISVTRITETMQRIFQPRVDYFQYQHDEMTWGGIARCSAEVCVVAIMLLMLVTMHQLSSSLQIIIGEFTIDQAKLYNFVVSLLAILATGTFAGVIVYLIMNNSEPSHVFETYSSAYAIIGISYTLTICWLISKLNKITVDGLSV